MEEHCSSNIDITNLRNYNTYTALTFKMDC